MRSIKIKFSELKVGDSFECGGNFCTKKSKRTAYIDKDHKLLWFYFGQNEYVILGWK